jgi:hypothetical protein
LLPTLAISASALTAAHDFSDDEDLALFHVAATTPWIEAYQDLDNNSQEENGKIIGKMR